CSGERAPNLLEMDNEPQAHVQPAVDQAIPERQRRSRLAVAQTALPGTPLHRPGYLPPQQSGGEEQQHSQKERSEHISQDCYYRRDDAEHVTPQFHEADWDY